MKIIIAGYGFVGKAVKNAFKKTHQIEIVDPKYTGDKVSNFMDADGLIICVGTPSDCDGKCDITNVLDALSQTPIHIPVMIKSTVTPNNAQLILEQYPGHSIVFSPEFLKANSANDDFLNQKYIIIGGEDPLDFWQLLFKSSLPNLKVIHKCTEQEACLVKYAVNSFLATKVSFFNHIYDLCENANLDFGTVRQLVCQDTRIGTGHSMVPGLDGERGWGGHCFPKDTQALVQYAKFLGQPFDLLETAIEYNNKVKKVVDNNDFSN
jgi:UDPglucose 6-dehydrogenase